MVESVPEIDRPARVMTLLVPTFLLAKVAVALDVDRVTLSPPITPESEAEFLLRSAVAESVALYSRLFAVMPVTVSVFLEMSAVAVGWVSV